MATRGVGCGLSSLKELEVPQRSDPLIGERYSLCSLFVVRVPCSVEKLSGS